MLFEADDYVHQDDFVGLNPSFDGICSLSWYAVKSNKISALGLNPSFDGICSLRALTIYVNKGIIVES